MALSLDHIFESALSRVDPQPFWLEPETRVFVYGTGTAGQEILSFLLGKGIAVAGFMDHRVRAERHIHGIPVFQPDDALIPEDQRDRSVAVIAIHNREADIVGISERLKTLGYKQVVNLIELYTLFASDLEMRYWLTAPRFYRSLKSPIETAFNLLSDETSRAIYLALLQFRLSADYSALPTPDMQHQYFAPDLPRWKTPIRLVDCGAYDGDTLASFVNNGIQLQSVAAFEPDQENFKKLARYVKENQKDMPESFLWPCGVSHTTMQLRFATGHGEASSFSGTGDTLVQCISLDEALPGFVPTIIKMDIEGAEYDALLGAQAVIAAHRPGLAISVYHRPEHLWQIPLLIAQIARNANIDYEFSLRLHGQNGFDTIFYAIPKS